MKKLLFLFLSILLVKQSVFATERPFVTARLKGQLGNQMFQVATAYSLAKSNRAKLFLPDLLTQEKWGVKKNYEDVFFRFKADPLPRNVTYEYKYIAHDYRPIPFTKDMKINGCFFSEKYFYPYRHLIKELFAPPERITRYLEEKYPDILSHPLTVALHVRTFVKDDPKHKVYIFLGWDYYKEAMSLFPDDTLFIVCSDNIKFCEEGLNDCQQDIVFIKDNEYIQDFYLMSLCHHNIISNSTFSWWAAYLNSNKEKIVVAPSKWYSRSSDTVAMDIIPDENWIVLPVTIED